eukprot:m.415685 g.415685  ORF g.415685 m.415685 type:complete len:575 (+) comp16824_c1_seq17:2209-3933(+)
MALLPGLLRRVLPPLQRVSLDRSFDYIIVGAGSAGCVLANELTADGSKQVLLVEAGGWDWHPLIHIPAGVYSVFKNPSFNWNYQSEPEPHCNGRRIELPRGKVVGGSSAINAMVYMRGHPLDYDGWATRHGLPTWSHAHCLPYFKRCESSDRGPSPHRGGSGRLEVTQGQMDNPLFDALMTAGKQSGQGVSDDLNGFQPEGVARLDRTATSGGRRCSAADAHLLPALARPNLTLATGITVERVEIEQGKASGVRIRESGGESRVIRATDEVVLSAGAIKSPQLLMLSGIGPAGHLRSHGIECLHDLAGVGQNLQDHTCINIGWFCSTSGVSLDSLTHPLRKAAVGVQWLLGLGGPASSNIWEAGGLVFGHNHPAERVGYPNLQYHFCPVVSTYNGSHLTLSAGYQVQIDQLRPHSRGAVTLATADPAAPPAALFNYLSDPRDLAELVDAYRTGQDLLAQPAFDGFRGKAALPVTGTRLHTDAEIEAWVRGTSGTDYHPCGTCKMGRGDDATAVVDAELRVIGVEGLRVIDASVMPEVVSGNLNAPTQMIALRGADMIRGLPQLAPERPPFHFEG